MALNQSPELIPSSLKNSGVRVKWSQPTNRLSFVYR